MLNYIHQLNRFEELCTGVLPQKAQLIYYKLFKWSNRFGLGEPFLLSNSVLMSETGIANVNTFTLNRNILKQQGFIDFVPGKPGQKTQYVLLDLMQCGNTTLLTSCYQQQVTNDLLPQTELQTELQTEPTLNNNNNNIYINIKQTKVNKEKEKINKKEKEPKHQYGEYKNVLLSDGELEKLKDEFPADWQERIERVSEYCASKGKSYKNYLATIRTWARNEKKNVNNRPIRRNDAQAGYQRMMALLGGDNDGETG